MEEPNLVKLEDVHFALTQAFVLFGEEEFLIALVSGSLGRQYHLSPKHAKRLYLRLQQQIQSYERQFGELKTELPTGTGQATGGKSFGFQVQEPEGSGY